MRCASDAPRQRSASQTYLTSAGLRLRGGGRWRGGGDGQDGDGLGGEGYGGARCDGRGGGDNSGGDGRARLRRGRPRWRRQRTRCRNALAKKADSTLRSSQAVPHPSTNRALRCLTSEVERDPVHSTRYGRRRQKRKIPKQPPSFLPSPILPDPPHRSRHRTELNAEVANSQGRAFRLSCRAGLAGAQTSRQTARHQ